MELTRRDGLVASTFDEPTATRRAVLFLVLTFAVALAVSLPVIASARGWIPVAVPAGLATVVVFSPALAAVVLRLSDRGTAGVRAGLRPAAAGRVGRRWWAVAFLLAPVMLAASYGAYLLLGGASRPAPIAALLAGPVGAAAVPVFLLVALVLAFGEEYGWRGYLLPVLQTRFGAATASLVLGTFWFLWHVPLLSIAGQFVALHPSVTGDPLSASVIVGVNLLVALAILAVYGTASFTRWHAPAAEASADD